MKRTTRFLQNPFLLPHLLNPTPFLSTRQNSSSSSSPPIPIEESPTSHQNLTPEEVEKINLLLPRLCESNHLHEAIRLIDTVLLTNPPLNSLSLPLLIDRLSEEPNMTQSMSLLNRLKHNPSSHSSLLHINKLLITCYLKKHKFKEAMKILGWMWRPDSPCVVDTMLYRIVVKGLCRNNKTVEALRVVKKIVEDKVVVGDDLRNWVYRSLLREARIKEAKELDEGLSCDLVGGGGDDLQRVVGLLDRMIDDWTE